MKECSDGISVDDLPDNGMGGTVLVWVLGPLDIAIAQAVAKALCRSIGLSSESCVATSTEVAEKGADLLGTASGGLLVLCPRGAQVGVEAVDFLDHGSRAPVTAPARKSAAAASSRALPAPLPSIPWS
jgi:hypothetical protein